MANVMGKIFNMEGRVVHEGMEVGEKAIKNVIKGAEHTTSKVASKLGEEEYERAFKQLEYEDLFDKAEKVGTSKKHVYVDKDSKIVGNYANELKKNPNNNRAAINNSIRGATNDSNLEQKIGNRDFDRTQAELIEKNRTRAGSIRAKFNEQDELEKIAEGYANVGSSGTPKMENNPPISTPGHKELKSNRYDDMESYMKFQASKDHQEISKAFETKDYNNPLLEKHGVTKDTPIEQLKAMRNEAINGAKKEDAGLRDHLGYHRVPQKVTGAMGTMWLVNKLASSKGEQSNSQLYGQQPY